MGEEMSQQASMDHLKGDAASFAISCSSVGAASSADHLRAICRFRSLNVPALLKQQQSH